MNKDSKNGDQETYCFGKITQDQTEPTSDLRHRKEKNTVPVSQNFASSEESINSVEDCFPNPTLPVTVSKRNNFKLRTISDSGYEVGSPIGCRRGILKYTNNRLRSLSESCAEIYKNTDNGEPTLVLEEWPANKENEQDGEEIDSDKVKKTVRFSDTVRRQVFRSNSSILGQRKKNQRKQRNKKRSKEENSAVSSSVESEPEVFLTSVTDLMDAVTLSDSGIEVEDSDPAEGSPPISANPPKKKNKKQKKGKNRRRSWGSSPSNDLMFDLDL